MRKITVGFSRPHNKWKIISLIIRLIERVNYSHCFVSWDSQYLGRGMLYQADQLRVNFMNKKIFDDDALTVKSYDVEIDEEDYKKIIQAMVDTVGAKYGTLQLIGFIWVYFCKIFGKRVRNPFRSGFICSEAVYHVMSCLPENFIDIYMEENNLTKDDLTPKDLDEAFSRFHLPSDK